jgi:hypothetical protein
MELLMMMLKWKLVLVRLEIVVILMQDRCTVSAEHSIGSKIVCTHPMELLGDVCHVESHFGLFGHSVMSVQDSAQFALNVP